MKSNPALIVDTINFIFLITLMITSIYSAWVNLILKKISRFGLDAFVLLLFGKKKLNLIRNNPSSIQRMGVACLLVALGTFHPAYLTFIENIFPYIR